MVRNPIVGPLGRGLKGLLAKVKGRRDAAIIEQLARAPHPHAEKIAWALGHLGDGAPVEDRDWITRVETERERLLSLDTPLEDGSIEGYSGPDDTGITISQACHDSKRAKPALMLYLLTRALKPQRIIELGTNVGISSAFLGAAMKMNGGGSIVTLDGHPYKQKVAADVHGNLGLDNITYVPGLFADTLGDALQHAAPVDIAFIDGHHQYQPTLDYFEAILPHSATDAVFVFDDIRWSAGMAKAWAELRADERFGLVVDLQSIGICARAEKPSAPRTVLPPIHNALR